MRIIKINSCLECPYNITTYGRKTGKENRCKFTGVSITQIPGKVLSNCPLVDENKQK